MATASEVVLPISTQKHDPAWRHCLMIRANERTQLKCIYCFKLFLGGGIHRIKEHLARHKGNAASCPRVPEDVQQAMQQNLEAGMARRKRKSKADDLVVGSPNLSVTEGDNGLQLVAQPELLDSIVPKEEGREEGVNGTTRTARRKRMKCSRTPLRTPGVPWLGNCDFGSSAAKENVHMAIGRFLYEAGVPSEAVNSTYFKLMVEAISSAGPGLEPPSSHDIEGQIFEKSMEEVKGTLTRYKDTWARTGCSILADEWITDMGQTLINFFVYCPEGTMFLKSVDASQVVTSVCTLFELFQQVVEEVGVQNVVQVITNSSDCHALAGKHLMNESPTLFWMPCASRCIDAALEDLGKLEQISYITEEAESIIGFICNNDVVSNMMMKYTNVKEFILPTEACAAMKFITLKRVFALKDALITMVSSHEWTDYLETNSADANVVAEIICRQTFWSSCDMVVRLTEPLVRVLRISNSSKIPAMGYFFAGMCQAKEAIKNILIDKNTYKPYWDILDRAWDGQLPLPLHAAGFFLNPRFFYSIQEIPKEMSSGMLECIERLVPDVKIQDKINKELSLYKNAAGDFGRKMAIRARDTLLPAEWWSTYGGSCPNLTRLALRILSQTCSARGCEKSNILFEKLHHRSTHYSERERLNNHIFVQYNLRLQQSKVRKNELLEPVCADNINVVNGWSIDKNDGLSTEDEDLSWLSNGLLSNYVNEENAESSVAELEAEVIHGAGPYAEDDAHCTVENNYHDGISITRTHRS